MLVLLTCSKHVCVSRGKSSKLMAQIKVIRVAKTYKMSLFWLTHSPCSFDSTSRAWNIFKFSTSTSGNHICKQSIVINFLPYTLRSLRSFDRITITHRLSEVDKMLRRACIHSFNKNILIKWCQYYCTKCVLPT